MKLTMAFGAVVAALFLAATPPPADAPATGYYYDGAKKISITPHPELVAEFSKAGAKSAVKQAFPAAEELKAGAGAPHVFKVPSASFKQAKTETGTSISPVFRQGTSPAGRLMALPGGVVVTFKPEWTEAQVKAWLAAKGHVVQQKLAIKGNWYVLKTEPGQAALDLANALHEAKEVQAASPNWWFESTTR